MKRVPAAGLPAAGNRVFCDVEIADERCAQKAPRPSGGPERSRWAAAPFAARAAKGLKVEGLKTLNLEL